VTTKPINCRCSAQPHSRIGTLAAEGLSRRVLVFRSSNQGLKVSLSVRGARPLAGPIVQLRAPPCSCFRLGVGPRCPSFVRRRVVIFLIAADATLQCASLVFRDMRTSLSGRSEKPSLDWPPSTSVPTRLAGQPARAEAGLALLQLCPPVEEPLDLAPLAGALLPPLREGPAAGESKPLKLARLLSA
jgi:hypothetical protein